ESRPSPRHREKHRRGWQRWKSGYRWILRDYRRANAPGPSRKEALSRRSSGCPAVKGQSRRRTSFYRRRLYRRKRCREKMESKAVLIAPYINDDGRIVFGMDLLESIHLTLADNAKAGEKIGFLYLVVFF